MLMSCCILVIGPPPFLLEVHWTRPVFWSITVPALFLFGIGFALVTVSSGR